MLMDTEGSCKDVVGGHRFQTNDVHKPQDHEGTNGA